MSINSKQKGSRYERLACKKLKELGYEARRSQQYQGRRVRGAGDLHTNIPNIRIEVKGGYNDFNLTSSVVKDWVDTAIKETPEGQEIFIMWKKSRMDWVGIIRYGNGYAAFTDLQKAIDIANGKKYI